MNANLEKLEKKFGDRHKAAEALGITERHFRRIKQTGRTTRTIAVLVEKLLKEKAA